MELEMTITQGENGWILEYLGHDYLHKKVVTTRWARVTKELEEYFGWYDINRWYDINGKHSKKPFYDEDNC